MYRNTRAKYPLYTGKLRPAASNLLTRVNHPVTNVTLQP
jgi:hypothetical protein